MADSFHGLFLFRNIVRLVHQTQQVWFKKVNTNHVMSLTFFLFLLISFLAKSIGIQLHIQTCKNPAKNCNKISTVVFKWPNHPVKGWNKFVELVIFESTRSSFSHLFSGSACENPHVACSKVHFWSTFVRQGWRYRKLKSETNYIIYLSLVTELSPPQYVIRYFVGSWFHLM